MDVTPPPSVSRALLIQLSRKAFARGFTRRHHWQEMNRMVTVFNDGVLDQRHSTRRARELDTPSEQEKRVNCMYPPKHCDTFHNEADGREKYG